MTRAESLQTWLIETRDIARAILDAGNYYDSSGGPRALDPKSAAWRQMVALGKPLSAWQRADYENQIAICERWLAELPKCGERELRLLVDAIALQRSSLRLQSGLHHRMMRADREDAEIRRPLAIKQMKSGKRWSGKRRKPVSNATLEAEICRMHAERPRLTWSRVCALAGERHDITGKAVRDRLPHTKW